MPLRFFGAVLGAWFLALPIPQIQAGESLEQLLRKRVRAAQDACDYHLKIFEAGLNDANLETLYTWSVRLLKAQQALDKTPKGKIHSLEAHRQRMAEVEAIAKRRYDAGLERTDPGYYAAARYYRAEADIWLAEAKAKKMK